MTVVEYKKVFVPDEGVMHTLDVVGHANYGASGKDILCAAISTLVYTLVYGLEDGGDRLKYDYSLNEGNVHIQAMGIEPYGTACCKTLFSAVMHGFDKLEEQYPRYIKKRL